MSKRILMVEDTEDNRQIIRDLIATTDYELIEAVDGAAGVAAAAAEKPDLILMDIQLPVIDGYEAARRIKADPALQHIPIIAVTSYAFRATRRKPLLPGATVTLPSRSVRASCWQWSMNSFPEEAAPCTIRLAFSPSTTRRKTLKSCVCAWRRTVMKCRPQRMAKRGLARAREFGPDLILLDIMMPKLDGISVVRILKQDVSLRLIPVVLVTAKADTRDVVEGLDAGGDDYLTKPFEHQALLARVRSMLRQKALHDTVESQARRLEDQAAQLAAWNQSLEQRVAEQVTEIERMGRLRRFLPAEVADLIVAGEMGTGFSKATVAR